MKIDIVAPTELLWRGEADRVTIPAEGGEMGILEGHTPLIALLSQGRVAVRSHGRADRIFDVDGGFATVDQDHVYILVDKGHRVRE
ncbi:MAG: F0F1 ATP synthase subunit epsilon [Ancrocorticia sp.]|jgi:F-type H+-transporting ATPase subunit epsilon|nr:F0F1 ATP synthase subunit epsilon [Ancrocorticia sp.]MCI1895992.1 F0F1 ATP synthase subunit epsilon [Ancrocorticia sp.]MCI1932444.1 F0F1 ATP synthase subunit epsilon [Ancrocorticia sp.]MCI1964132.1 F0F1 ATP synthase subunit epsilon [Ancrocorticia sp.]MCI2002569.1 F0F1 ATP synthase subunit epsilon [Ancrocorticia sp.]